MNNTLSNEKYQKLIKIYQVGDYIGLLSATVSYLKSYPTDSRLIELAGFACIRTGRYRDAAVHYEAFITLNSESESGYINLALVCKNLGEIDRAFTLYNKALEINPNNSDLLNNLGNLYLGSGENQKAKRFFIKAIKYRSNFAEAHSNLGIAYKNLSELGNARENFVKAIQLKPDYSDAYFQLGLTFKAEAEHSLAIHNFNKALEFNPKHHGAYAHKLQQKAMICDWEEREHPPEVIPTIGSERDVPPFGMLYFDDNPENQRQRSRNYGLKFLPKNGPNSAANVYEKKGKNKIHIAYFSGEFHQHPVMHLMAPVFLLHNRKDFEVSAFCYGQEVLDATHKKLKSCFDQFLEVRSCSDRKIADLSASLSVDIAVDLSGYTRNGRPGIFGYRAAPVQVNYLGYPGTMGVEFYDYIIADENLVPPSDRSYFAENVLYLKPGYQLSDDSRPQFDYQISRKRLRVEKDSFIFISFNNTTKISPELFDAWVRILKKVDNSFLWLVKSNKWAEENLKKEAMKLGLNKDRLVFWEHCEYEEYLTRLSAADLFLDTVCFNAGATANDALWCGVPLITIMGKSYHSRMSGSLLKALNMEELIVDNLNDYEDLAIRLANNMTTLSLVKSKLTRNRKNSKLFNTSSMVFELESVYRQILNAE